MKIEITHHEIREVDGSIILYIHYEYKGLKGTGSIIDLQDRVEGKKLPAPDGKELKQYIRTAELALNKNIKEKEENENKFKKEVKEKQRELTEMRKFVNSRSHNQESLKKAIEEFKQLKNVSKKDLPA